MVLQWSQNKGALRAPKYLYLKKLLSSLGAWFYNEKPQRAEGRLRASRRGQAQRLCNNDLVTATSFWSEVAS